MIKLYPPTAPSHMTGFLVYQSSKHLDKTLPLPVFDVRLVLYFDVRVMDEKDFLICPESQMASSSMVKSRLKGTLIRNKTKSISLWAISSGCGKMHLVPLNVECFRCKSLFRFA